MNSITKRWVRGSLLVTILMCLVAEAVFLYYSITNYYDGARRAMTTRTSTIITQLNASAAQTGESQGVLLRRMVEQFTEKDKFELMLVNAAGKPLVTSTGFAPDDSVAGEDYLEALASEKGEGHAVYRTAMGEKVMAVTTLLPRAAGEIVAVRFVTSLTLVDQSIAALVAFSLALVTAVVLFSVWTGMFFIRSIVRPIGEIEATAAKIAEGNLDTRIENKYNDEIGKLSDTINHMAGELDKTERMKNDFISSVSHELRTPLTAIGGWSETLLAGGGENMPKMQAKAQMLGIAEHVRFLGVRSDVNDLIQTMDVFVFPSLYEGLPVTMVEAQAAGLPCLISDKVPPECILTEGLVDVLPLSAAPETWTERILEKRNLPRTDRRAEIAAHGFDITTEAVKLQEFYLEAAE